MFHRRSVAEDVCPARGRGRLKIWRTAALAAVVVCGAAHAGVIVDIDSQKYGCSQCNGPQNILPGTVVNIFTPKLQETLGPGTYTFTNNTSTGYYSAWNFNGYPTSGNWVWSFVAADDATSTVLMDDYTAPIAATQAAQAAETGIVTYDGNTVLSATTTAGFTDTLTLGSTTTLDFFIDDYALGDNGGGVELNITGQGSAPEPSTLVLLAGGFLGIAARRFCLTRNRDRVKP